MHKFAKDLTSPSRNRLLYYGVLTSLFVILSHVAIISRQGSWEDEVFAVSTGWSMAHGKPPQLSVLALFPNTISPVRFYGPVSFESAALLFRMFGLSMTAWRLLCFMGVVLTAIVAARLVREAGGDRWAQCITLLLASLSGSIGTWFPGRFDFVASGLFLSGLLLMSSAYQVVGRKMIGRLGAAGVCAGLALGSTPRVLTLMLSAAAGVIVAACVVKQKRARTLLSAMAVLFVACIIHSFLLARWGQNELSWFDFVRHATSQDYINASPLTGKGTWNLNLSYYKLFSALLVMLLVIGLLGTWAQRKREASDEQLVVRIFLSVFALVNLGLMILTLSRPVGQVPFWLPPLLIASMSWFRWQYFQGISSKIFSVALVGACLTLLFVRDSQQITGMLLAWPSLDRSDLVPFLRQNLPRGATVLGPVGGYFYPVTLSGNTYLYPYEMTTPGLYSDPPAKIREVIDKQICGHPTFAIWPEPRPQQKPIAWRPMPEELQRRLLPPGNEFVQPDIAPWRDSLLRLIGMGADPFGVYDVRIWPLRSLEGCQS